MFLLGGKKSFPKEKAYSNLNVDENLSPEKKGVKSKPFKEKKQIESRGRDKLLINNGGTVMSGNNLIPSSLIQSAQGQQKTSTANQKSHSVVRYQSFKERDMEIKTLIQTLQHNNSTNISQTVNKLSQIQNDTRQDGNLSQSNKSVGLGSATKQSSKLQNGGAYQINNRTNSVQMNMSNQKPQQIVNINNQRLKKKVENLPRTGIEYPITKERRIFIKSHREFEPLSEQIVSQKLIEEYIRNDSERANQIQGQIQVVYDCIEMSPFYDPEDINDQYYDERDAIEVPPPQDQSDGIINEPYQKKYFFNPNNLPYQLERVGQFYGSQTADSRLYDKKGMPRINRYYEKLKPFYKLKDPISDKTLIFESRFESGNLKKAIKVGEYEYDLILKNDYGTSGFTQWYYFKVSNTRKDIRYRFNIINLMKPESTYSMGMKPLLYSVKEADKNGLGWYRDGTNIAYYLNARKKNSATAGTSSTASTQASTTGAGSGYYGSYYSLTFEVEFKHDLDTVYLAHCYPYTYSDLCDQIKKICTYQNKDKIRRTVLCKSLAGNDVEMLIVTNFASSPEQIAMRKAIILTSRVHPGETNASFMMDGVLDFLVGDDSKACFLRDTYVFKIIPMLNPDGVIVGNYRCSLSGQDLNRQWIAPSCKLYPVNYHTKLMMRKTLESREILFFCDFHGHSTKRNIFMYGNNQVKAADKLKERVFPTMFSENNENFSFEDCSFDVQKSREKCSFCGPSKGMYNGCHFNAMLLDMIGSVFCKTLADYSERELGLLMQ